MLGGAVASCSNPSDSLIPNDMGGVGNISITSVSPAVVGIAGGTPVAVYGTGFAAGATVAFGNKLATQVQVISSTQIQMLAPAAENGPGAVPVTVRNADGSFAVATGLFRYVRVVLDFDNTRVPVGTQPVAVIAEDTKWRWEPGNHHCQRRYGQRIGAAGELELSKWVDVSDAGRSDGTCGGGL